MDIGANRVDIDALLRLFTCPGCGNPANKPPLFQCVKGHVACSSCSVKCRGSCPTCRQRMTTERNFWMEEASTCIIFPLRTAATADDRNGVKH
ncbi:e3 ubiquitin protein ligase siah1 [Daphnia magna]|uniref:E3 ubiquitin protein ligase siah1 n=1 Tax=Daphnia magna TaxID=35525 RepID=A0A0P5H491_9CRUS|nr:e3 ubiquitin protein ligase siah1 [Daphnia magna]